MIAHLVRDPLIQKQYPHFPNWHIWRNGKSWEAHDAQVIEPLQLSLDELRKFDGSDKSQPMYLAIKGTIFDISKGNPSTPIQFTVKTSEGGLSMIWTIDYTFMPHASFYMTGRQFYGPDGIYPFAGRECARAFALLSTDTDDCSENTEGLDKMELDNLRDWQEKFHTKYKLVGRVVK